ncbi:MAG: HAD family hydrolase [Planctomycetota bacterium]|jgi:phosphoglycolate phosphatase-like HAD superfamily hydrolase
MADIDHAKPLRDFKPQKEFFVGIDSDGCAFDTMGIKQRECFCPWLIAHFGLQPDPMVKDRGFEVPQYPHYFKWVDDPNSLLSNDGLEQAIAAASDPQAKAELQLALEWSKQVNWAIAQIVKDMPPFPFVRECLEKITPLTDVIVVSATPCEALAREWAEHDIAQYARVIAGQEMGKKAEHLALAANGKYPKNNILMIGDAPGDMKAAKANDALFYPIIPGHEIQSWKRFGDEAFDKFVTGQYAEGYEQKLIAEFDASLPETPPWQK